MQNIASHLNNIFVTYNILTDQKNNTCTCLNLFLNIIRETRKLEKNCSLCRLWEDGFKDRYYKNKFDVDSDDIAFRHQVVRDSVKLVKDIHRTCKIHILIYFYMSNYYVSSDKRKRKKKCCRIIVIKAAK